MEDRPNQRIKRFSCHPITSSCQLFASITQKLLVICDLLIATASTKKWHSCCPTPASLRPIAVIQQPAGTSDPHCRSRVRQTTRQRNSRRQAVLRHSPTHCPVVVCRRLPLHPAQAAAQTKQQQEGPAAASMLCFTAQSSCSPASNVACVVSFAWIDQTCQQCCPCNRLLAC